MEVVLKFSFTKPDLEIILNSLPCNLQNTNREFDNKQFESFTNPKTKKMQCTW